MTSKVAAHTPPLVGLGHLRRAHGYTLDQVAEAVGAILGRTTTKGAISAVENGLRKPSPKLLEALLDFYEIRDAEFVYPAPRLLPRPVKNEAAA